MMKFLKVITIPLIISFIWGAFIIYVCEWNVSTWQYYVFGMPIFIGVGVFCEEITSFVRRTIKW
jgi:hypothetical protein